MYADTILRQSYQFHQNQELLVSVLASAQGKALSICGAGKNGRFLCALLTSNNHQVRRVYDDAPQGDICGVPVEQLPGHLPADETVVVSFAPDSPHFSRSVEVLERMGADYVCLSPANAAAADSHESSAGPRSHQLGAKELAAYRDNRISRFSNLHKGEQCVIVGNGPSLNKMDLSVLDNEYTFGLNKIYLLFARSPFRPTYICSYIKDVVQQAKDDFLKLHDIPIFVSHESLDLIPPHNDHIFHLGPHKRFCFSQNPIEEICCGYTVTYVAMQLAAYMGFSKIILIGVDHNFANFSGKGDKWIKIDTPRDTHFDPSYFSSGQFWQTPNFPMIEAHFSYAKAVFEILGVEVLDATLGGQLQIFPKTNLEEALKR